MVNEEAVKFKYLEVVAVNYKYRGAVDNHNALRNDGRTNSQIGLESAWGTTGWPIPVLSFFRIVY